MTSLKKLFLFCLVLLATPAIHSQDNPLDVTQYTLHNGLTVYLNVDHNQPVVMGAVAVKGGSKRDPKDATGIAHYLEHMMFKGTQTMGTIDFKSEKVYLDSITLLYDELGKTTDEKVREKIQININRLSLKAGEYAIPNEFDKIMADMGASNVNAFTNEDNIVYFNLFPPNQMEKWLKLYSDRFINPVFRLFQPELETVYEEKNMSMDDFGSVLFETFAENFFKKSPYGQQTVLGNIEHLKNPSLSKMYEYFHTYYVANNMALILTGDFDKDAVIPLIEKYFGVWKQGEIPPLPDVHEEPFKGRELVKKRLTPIPVGIMGFRTVKESHPDEIILNVCSEILSNNSSTGFFDKLYMDNKIMNASMFQYSYVDDGGAVVIFIPKLLTQSLRKAEKLVLAEIEKLKKGEFTDSLLNAIKVSEKKSFEKSLENLQNRGFNLLTAFNSGKSWEEIVSYPEQIDGITKEDIVRIANKYFGDNYLVLYSKMGIPPKEKLKKPPYKPVIPKNSEAQSEFALELKKIPVNPIEPKFIDFEKDVMVNTPREGLTIFYTPNPVNNIFSLTLQFGVGTNKIPGLDYSAQYLGLIGTEKRSFSDFKKALQSIGSSLYCYTGTDYMYINLDGLEENLEQTLTLLNELLVSMKGDEKQIEKFHREAKSDYKTEIKDPSTIGNALEEYALYKEKSGYINRLSLKEIKNLKSDSLIAWLKQAMKYQAEIHYVGKKDINEVQNLLISKLSLPEKFIPSTSPEILKRQEWKENTIYILDDKSMIQSQIYLIKEGRPNDMDERRIAIAFNEYFGNGMNSIVFQEIREFRSLAYGTSATYYLPFHIGRQGFLEGFLSTQADKTVEAIEAMTQLIGKMPEKPERMETVKASLIQTINTERPTFRRISFTVSRFLRQGFTEDPRRKSVEVWKNMDFSAISNFHENNFAGKPFLITIAGDKSRMNLDELAKFGKIIEVKKEDIFRK